MSENEVVKEFKECVGCRGKRWLLQEELANEVKAGRMKGESKVGFVEAVRFMDEGRVKRVGDEFTNLIIVSDICMGCGRRQVIRVDRVMGRVTMDVSSLAKPPAGMMSRSQLIGRN